MEYLAKVHWRRAFTNAFFISLCLPLVEQVPSGWLGILTIKRVRKSISLTRTFSTADFSTCQCPLILNTMYTQMIEHCTGAGKIRYCSTLDHSFDSSMSDRTNGKDDGGYVRILVCVYHILQHTPGNEDFERCHADVRGSFCAEKCTLFLFLNKKKTF